MDGRALLIGVVLGLVVVQVWALDGEDHRMGGKR